MTKPILWLGPLEDIDADFDPLLGRSASLPVSAAATVTAAPLADDRSVFDEPSEPIVPNAAALPASEPIVQSNQTEVAAPIEVLPETGVTSETSLTAEAAGEPIDFEHNNDPIPMSGLASLEQDLEERHTPKSLLRDEQDDEIAVEPKKSLLEKLFSPEAFVPVTATPATVNVGSNSDEDIRLETGIAPEPETPQNEMMSELPEALAFDDNKDAAAQPTPIEILPAAENTSQKEPESILEAHQILNAGQISQAEPTNVDIPEGEATAPALLEPIVTPEPAVEAVEEAPAFVLTGEPEPQSSSPSNPINFQRAFDADNFWAIPKGQRVSDASTHPEEEILQDNAKNEAILETVDQPSLFSPDEKIDAPVDAQTIQNDGDLKPAFVPPTRPTAQRRRNKKRAKKNYVATFFGTFLIGFAAIMTMASTAAPLGYPFDMLSSYRWYWVTIAVVAAAIWGISRGWKMVGVSFLVIAANLAVTVPATGKAPVGGKTATAVVGWANVGNSTAALTRVFVDADKKQASLLMIAQAPQSVFTPPAGWALIEAPVAGDPTAIAVLSKSSWRAVTVPGEPTMARPPAGDLTVIGIHPLDAIKGQRSTPARSALINRAAARAGNQQGATIVFGDFNAPPWDLSIDDIRSVGDVTRVRCGGWTGSTLSKGFGLLGIASDHAFVRDVKVTHCQLSATLPDSGHKPIWLFVSPQVEPTQETPDN
jgi:hypothetical protein